MIKSLLLEDLIRDNVQMDAPDVRGFHSLKCQVCNDYKVRAGFKFSDGVIGYNCWNCSTTGTFEEHSGRISRNFRRVLNAYGIEDSEINNVISTAFFVEKPVEENISLAALQKINTNTPEIELPPKSFRLGGNDEFLQYQEKLAMYLVDRKMDLEKYPFYFSLEPRMMNRVIIPFYRRGKLIYWQARSIDKDVHRRYDNSVNPREAVMFNMDQLGSHSPLPLFVSEGVFDAAMFDGIAILGSKLTDAKLELLKKAKRRLVFVIDKDKNGRSLASTVMSHGWDITFAPDGAEDVNRSVMRFGYAWTALQLMNNIPSNPDVAQLQINLNCN